MTDAATPADWRPRIIAAPCRADRGRVVAERADPHRRVARLRRQVEDRGVDDVDAQRPRLAPDRGADPFGQPVVIDRPERHVSGELGRLGAECVELAAFLVGGDEEGAVGAAGAVEPPPARCTASVNSRTCASRMTLTAMNSVTPAAGASASRFVTQLGTPSPSKASITRSRIRSAVTP